MSTEQINIKDVLQKSTSDVPLAELAKKGFRNVKVLNRAAINELISDAVDRVISERLAEAKDTDRSEIEAESRAKFDKLLGEKKEAAQAVAAYEERIQSLETQAAEGSAAYDEKIQDLETQLALREQRISSLEEQVAQAQAHATALAGSGDGGSKMDLTAIQDSIEKLTRRLASGGAAGEAPLDEKEAEFAVRAMLAAVTEGDETVETNTKDVHVKKSKARGLKGTLDKLKNLQKEDT